MNPSDVKMILFDLCKLWEYCKNDPPENCAYDALGYSENEIKGAVEMALEAIDTHSSTCKGCWVWKSKMNYNRCKSCKRNFGDRYIEVEDD